MSCEDKGCGCRKAWQDYKIKHWSDRFVPRDKDFSAGWHNRNQTAERELKDTVDEYSKILLKVDKQFVEKDKEIAYLRRQWQREMKAQEEGAK